MATERVTERRDGDTRERVVERGETSGTTVVERSGGAGLGAIVAIVLIVALVAAAAFLLTSYRQEAAETAAVSSAAESVGQAADSVGQAARDASESLPAAPAR